MFAFTEFGLARMIPFCQSDCGPSDLEAGAQVARDDLQWLRQGHNGMEEVQTVQRHEIPGETIAWRDQGYAWAEQRAVHWLFVAVFLFGVLPYAVIRFGRPAKHAWRRLSSGRSFRLSPAAQHGASNPPRSTCP
jgi:hypothetical protein